MKFQMDPDLPSVLVMQSSTHFRQVLNDMLDVSESTDSKQTTEKTPLTVPSARLPPIHLTDEESESKYIENENSTKNIGKFPPNENSETVEKTMASKVTQKLEYKESTENEFLQVPEIISEEIDTKNGTIQPV